MLKALASLLWIRKPHSCLTCAFYLLCTKEAPEAAWPTSFQGSLGNGCSQAPWKCCPVPSGLATFSFLSLLFSPEKYWQILFSPFHYIFSDILLWGIYSKDSRCPALHGKVGNILDCWTVTVVARGELVVAVWQTPKTPNAVCPASIPVSSAKSLLIFLWEMLILHSQFMGLKGHVSQKWHSNWIRETQVTLARPGGSGCLREPSGDGNSSCGVC